MSDADLGRIVESYWKFDRLLFEWLKDKTRSAFTFTQFITLQFLKTSGPQALKNISAYLSITPASTSTMIKKMENEGLVTCKEDPNDRRIHLVQITEKGIKQLESYLGVMEAFFEKTIPENAREAYLRIIHSAFGEN